MDEYLENINVMKIYYPAFCCSTLYRQNVFKYLKQYSSSASYSDVSKYVF